MDPISAIGFGAGEMFSFFNSIFPDAPSSPIWLSPTDFQPVRNNTNMYLLGGIGILLLVIIVAIIFIKK